MDWFESWFDNKYYHILYENRNDEEAEIFLTNLTSLYFFKEKSDIIDIACGKGRHSLFLSKLGHNVTGIDLSNNSIMHAKKYENKNLNFQVADMRKTFKRNSYDIALNLFTSFGYFETKEDNIQSLNAMSSNLKKEGILIIDFLNIKKTLTELIKKESKKIKNIEFNISRKFKNGFILKNISIKDHQKTYSFQEKVQALSKNDFLQLLNYAKMTIIDTFGDYNLNTFDQDTSERFIIIAKKWN